MAVLPYAATLTKKTLTSELVLKNLVASSITMVIVVGLAIPLARRVGLGSAIIERWLRGEKIGAELLSIITISIPSGILAGLLVIGSQAVINGGLHGSKLNPPAWQGFLASFYGAIGEELQCRFFLMSLIVFVFGLIVNRLTKPPGKGILWTSNVLAALLFAAAHLPTAAALGPLTPFTVMAVMVPNTLCGLVFGWLYYSRGLEAAMIAHFSADILLHVVLPMILHG